MARPAGPRLAPSATREIAATVAGARPAARIEIGREGVALRRMARRLGLFASSDCEGYAVLSRQAATARRILDLDRRPGRHTHALGVMLGYPRCCSRAAARHGDEGIDAMAAALASRRFHGLFRLTDPAGYGDGRGRLSHVPCSHRCAASLALALRAGEC